MSLDLRAIILASLAATPGACGFVPSEFDIDAELDAETLARVAEKHPGELAELSCNVFCHEALTQLRGRQRQIKALDSCSIEPAEADAVRVRCSGQDTPLMEGRRPFAHVPHTRSDHAVVELGPVLAELAHLEAASIFAFNELGAWLAEFEAPDELLLRCAQAAEDERRHAGVLSTLAGRMGAATPIPRSVDRPTPGLAEVAVHNVVEGCVYESFAAMIACLRAETASDATLRAVYRMIAGDEIRHGQLAWDIHEWLLGKLDERERQQVVAARRLALTKLPLRARALASLPIALQKLEPETAEQLAWEFAEQLAA